MAAVQRTAEEIGAFAEKLGLSADSLAKYTAAITELEYSAYATSLLQLLYPTLTHSPTSPAYDASRKLNWSQRAWLPAGMIFIPTTAEAVAHAVRILSFFNTPFAVRSGGHTPWPGAASIADGVLISLEKLTSLSLSADKKICSVGGGNRWEAVFRFLEPDNLAVVSGRLRDIGVGGLILSGGNSYWSTAYGLSCDNVAAFEVALADGRLVVASASENADLFRALKGGCNNFGVVTRFDLETIQLQRPEGVWGGNLVYALMPETMGTVLDCVADYQATGQLADPESAIIPSMVCADSGRMQFFHVTVFHAHGEKPATLDKFFAAGPVADTTAVRKMVDQAFEAAGGEATATLPNFRQDFRTLTIGVSAALYRAIAAAWQTRFTPALAGVAGFQASLTFQPIAASTVARGREKGGNSLGLEERAQTWLCFTSQWVLEADDDTVLAKVKAFMEEVRRMAEEHGLAMRYLFMNDAAADQPVIECYGEENVKALKKTAAKYDPEGVFQKLCAGGFKLG